MTSWAREPYVDEMTVSVVPSFLGGGDRLFDNVGGPDRRLEQVRVMGAPGVAHLRYRVLNSST